MGAFMGVLILGEALLLTQCLAIGIVVISAAGAAVNAGAMFPPGSSPERPGRVEGSA